MLQPAQESSDKEARHSVAFILQLGRALHSYGYPAHRLEAILEAVARHLELEGQFFATPTSLLASFGPQENQRTFMMRVEPGQNDLGRLADLNQVTMSVLENALTPAEGLARINEILASPPLYGRLLTTAAFGLASAAASVFLGGGERELLVSAGIGIVIGLLSMIAAESVSFGRVFEAVAAFAASSLAALLATEVAPHSISNAVLAGMIVLVPGLTLTTAITELSSRHLVSGTATLTGAFVVFLKLGFGVALGSKVMSSLLGSTPVRAPIPLPGWAEYVALIAAPVGFTILLRAHKRDAIWIVIAGAIAVFSSRAGAQWLGPELGVFVGSLSVGTASNLYARFMNRPSTVMLVPGILLLVPGSIGFRSITSMLDEKVVPGVETAFKMVLIAVALVAGILMSRIVAPSRRIV